MAGVAATKPRGYQVFGLEGNVFIEVFNDWNGSVELLGLYESNTIQGDGGDRLQLCRQFLLGCQGDVSTVDDTHPYLPLPFSAITPSASRSLQKREGEES